MSSFVKGSGKESQPKSSIWNRATDGFISVNVAAKYDIDMGSRAIGVEIRDDKGRFLAASSQIIPFVIDAATAEAQAV